MKVNIQNSLKSIILKNLSEDRTGSRLLRKNSIKTNTCSEDKRISKNLNRPFSQNTNRAKPKIELMLDCEEKELINYNNENQSNLPIRRRINFNSINNNFPKSTKNSNTDNLNLNDTEDNEFPLDCSQLKRKFNDVKKNNILATNNFNNNNLKTKTFQTNELEVYFQENNLESNNFT